MACMPVGDNAWNGCNVEGSQLWLTSLLHRHNCQQLLARAQQPASCVNKAAYAVLPAVGINDRLCINKP